MLYYRFTVETAVVSCAKDPHIIYMEKDAKCLRGARPFVAVARKTRTTSVCAR